MEYDLFHLEISHFIHFIVQILFHKSNDVQSVSSFKILNDVAVCILLNLRYLIYTMKWRVSISNREFQIKWRLSISFQIEGFSKGISSVKKKTINEVS